MSETSRFDGEGNMAAVLGQTEAQADASAAELIRHGWTDVGDMYDIGTYHGDTEALEARIGRATTKDERRVLETKIRERLDAAYQGEEPSDS